jgi:MoxR-like ATPase
VLNLNNTNSSVILARELNKVFDFFFPTIDIPASLRKRVADLKTHPLGYVERIRLIEELAELSPGDPDSPEGVRFAVMMAHLHFRQSECAKFPGKKTKRALINLMAALYDLDHGIVWPLLQPTTVSHRAKDSLRAEEAKKRTAAACELLKRRGRALPEAAGQVAKLLAPHKEQLGIGDISREKVCSLAQEVLPRS